MFSKEWHRKQFQSKAQRPPSVRVQIRQREQETRRAQRKRIAHFIFISLTTSKLPGEQVPPVFSLRYRENNLILICCYITKTGSYSSWAFPAQSMSSRLGLHWMHPESVCPTLDNPILTFGLRRCRRHSGVPVILFSL